MRLIHTAWVSPPLLLSPVVSKGGTPQLPTDPGSEKRTLTCVRDRALPGPPQLRRGLKSATHADLQGPAEAGAHEVTGLGSPGAPPAVPVPAPGVAGLPNGPSLPPASGVEPVGEPPIRFPPHLTRVHTCPLCITGSHSLCLHTRHGSTEAPCVCNSPDHPEQSSLKIVWFLHARTY